MQYLSWIIPGEPRMNSRVVRNVIAALVLVGCTGDSITSPPSSDLLSEAPLAVGVDENTGASIATDKDDYVPGDTVKLSGQGWAPGETVRLYLTEEPQIHPDSTWNVVADANGLLADSSYIVNVHDVGVTFTLNATGLTSGSSATVVYTDDREIDNVEILDPRTGLYVDIDNEPVVVPPGSTVTVRVTGDTDDDGSTSTDDDWQCTRWQLWNAVNTGSILHNGFDNGINVTGDVSNAQHVFTFTAPTTQDAYSLRIRTMSTDGCGTEQTPDGIDTQIRALIVNAITSVELQDPVGPTYVLLDGQAPPAVTVALGTATANVRVTADVEVATGGEDDWQSTSVQVRNAANTSSISTTCSNTVNYSSVQAAGTDVVNFPVPATAGTYSLLIRTFDDDNCDDSDGDGDPRDKRGDSWQTAVLIVTDPTQITLVELQDPATSNWVTIDDAAPPSVTVTVGATVNARITANTGGSDNDWESLQWAVREPDNSSSVVGPTCTDGPNFTTTTSGALHAFTFTAPNDPGTYTLRFRIYDENGCDSDDQRDETVHLTVLVVRQISAVEIQDPANSNWILLDGAAPPSITVNPSAVFNARLTVTTRGDDSDDDWQSTQWTVRNEANTSSVVGPTCDAGPEFTSDITNQTYTFPVTAPAAPGTYTLRFRIYDDNSCDSDDLREENIQTAVLIVAANAATETTVSGTLDPTKHGATVTITADVELFNTTTAVTTGNVEFRIGSTTCSNGTVLPGGPFALNGSGQASTTRAFTFSEDNSNIRACYLGAAGFQTSNGEYIQDVEKADVGVTVNASPAGSSNAGQNVTFTVTSLPVVAPGVGTPTGNVRFYDGACGTTQIGSADNTAPYSVSTTALAAGAHTISACYEGDGNFNSNSGSVAHTVSLNATSLTIVSSAGNTLVTGQPSFMSAFVTSGGNPVTVGSVTFRKGADCSTGSLLEGPVSYTVEAGLGGGGFHAGSFRFAAATDPSPNVLACYTEGTTFAGTSNNLTLTVNRAATSTTATDNNEGAVFGTTVSFTGSVAVTSPGATLLFPPPAGTVFPTGNVNFYELLGGGTCAAPGGTSVSLGAGTLPGNGNPTPNVDYALLGGGVHVITACYAGDGNFLPSGVASGTTEHTVNKATSSLVLTTNTPTVFGNAANFTATMGTNPAGNPTGNVTFYLGGTCNTTTGLGTGTALDLTNALSGNPAVAQGTNSTLDFGANNIVACYGGDANFTGSTDSETHNVTAAVTQTVLSSATENGAFGNAITLTATVTVPLNAALDPPGTVQFFFNNACSGTSLGSVAVNTTTNQAVLTIAAASAELQNFTVGTHNLRACYTSSSTNYGGSNGGDTHTVTAVGTTTTASTTTTTPQYSDEITLRASVSPHTLNGQEVTGNVRFYFGSAMVCPVADPTAAGAGVIGSDNIEAADDGVSDDAPDYQITSVASATPYKLTACFYSTNANFGHDGDDEDVTVTTEDATITPDASNINSIATAPGGTSVASITLKFIVKETNPEPDANAGALAGNINNVAFGVQLLAVGAGANNETGTCNAGVVAGTGYSQTKTYTCTFSTVALDAYEVVSTVSGNYYDGTDSDALSVYDPSAGFVTGGGKFDFPGASPAEKVNFGLVFMNPSKKAVRGNLLVIRHMTNGDICRVKSNGLEAPAITQNAASWAGKGNYNCSRPDGTQYDGSGNLTITGWVQDNGQGSTATGPDKFWVKVSGALNNNLVMPGTGPANAASLTGGNIQVPQPGR